MVIVPVGGMSRLVREGISVAMSMGDEVVAVTVCYADPEAREFEHKLRDEWDQWHPGVPLVTLHSTERSLGQPIVDYLTGLEDRADHDQLVVLIPEVQANRPWRRVLHNQRGFVLEQAINHGTKNVVVCRLRYRLAAVSALDDPAARAPDLPG
jgi:hypothetical protein